MTYLGIAAIAFGGLALLDWRRRKADRASALRWDELRLAQRMRELSARRAARSRNR